VRRTYEIVKLIRTDIKLIRTDVKLIRTDVKLIRTDVKLIRTDFNYCCLSVIVGYCYVPIPRLSITGQIVVSE
jgi:hypothetical protein